jgi:hypothetical protein
VITLLAGCQLVFEQRPLDVADAPAPDADVQARCTPTAATLTRLGSGATLSVDEARTIAVRVSPAQIVESAELSIDVNPDFTQVLPEGPLDDMFLYTSISANGADLYVGMTTGVQAEYIVRRYERIGSKLYEFRSQLAFVNENDTPVTLTSTLYVGAPTRTVPPRLIMSVLNRNEFAEFEETETRDVWKRKNLFPDGKLAPTNHDANLTPDGLRIVFVAKDNIMYADREDLEDAFGPARVLYTNSTFAMTTPHLVSCSAVYFSAKDLATGESTSYLLPLE